MSTDITDMQTGQDEVLEGEERDIQDTFIRIAEIAQELEQHPDPAVRDKVFEMLDWVEAFHREAVVRIVQMLPLEAVEQLHSDPVVHHLIDTYIEDEEEPENLDALIDEALNEIRPYIHSHGGEMEALNVDKESGIVKLRLMGSCHGCPSSSVTLTDGVEKILRDRWPGFRKLDVEGMEEEAGPKKLLQINTMRRK